MPQLSPGRLPGVWLAKPYSEPQPVGPPSSTIVSPGLTADQLILSSSFQAVAQLRPSAPLPVFETYQVAPVVAAVGVGVGATAVAVGVAVGLGGPAVGVAV